MWLSVQKCTEVFQYSAGRAVQDKSFLYCKEVNQPPTVLQRAINALKARHKMLGNPIHSSVVRTIERYPHMKDEFRRLDLDSDKLFKPNITHQLLCDDALRC